jgi:hypothetical protein
MAGMTPRPIPAARAAATIIATAALALLAACGASPASAGPGRPASAGPGRPASAGPGRPASAGTGSAAAGSAAVSYAHCMRSHGLPDYPDPGSSGTLPKTSARLRGVSTAVYTAAQNACQNLLPEVGTSLTNGSLQQCYLAGICPQALVQQALNAGRVFAQCMRAHGVPNWPDPSPYSQDPVRPTFNLHAAGIDFHQGTQPGNIVNSPQIEAKVRACESVVHENVSGYFQ